MSEFDSYRESYVTDINKAIRFSGKGVDFYSLVKADILAAYFSALGDCPAVLDVGCGHGLIHGHLTQRLPDARLTGIDVAQSVVEEAQRTHPNVTYHSYDGVRLPYADGQFDAVYTICVLHHVEPADRDALIAEMARVTRPGGLVCVMEHNPLNPLTQYIVNTCPVDENAKLLWPGETRGRAQRAGLSVVEQRYFLFTPFGAGLFRWLDRQLGWLPLGAQYSVLARVPGAETQ